MCAKFDMPQGSQVIPQIKLALVDYGIESQGCIVRSITTTTKLLVLCRRNPLVDAQFFLESDRVSFPLTSVAEKSLSRMSDRPKAAALGAIVAVTAWMTSRLFEQVSDLVFRYCSHWAISPIPSHVRHFAEKPSPKPSAHSKQEQTFSPRQWGHVTVTRRGSWTVFRASSSAMPVKHPCLSMSARISLPTITVSVP
jgi:hypothetical protein